MPSVPATLAALSRQPRVRDFLASALAEGRLSHAYLFAGAPGSGRTEAALALARCVVCPEGGDGTCGECIRVAHGTHPDVRVLRPSGAQGYLAEQADELVRDAQLSPMRARAKVYVLERAETLGRSAANALLKTIEEPPEGVHFVLVARSADAVLPTIASRCQVVPFRPPSEAEARRELERSCGAEPERAAIALSVAGTVDEARQLLLSPDRLEVRRLVVRVLSELPDDDGWDVLCAARRIVEACDAPLETLRGEQAARQEAYADFLSAGARRQAAAADRRELTARERSSIMEALSAAESFLRDVLLSVEGLRDRMVNVDCADAICRIARHATPSGAIRALGACSRAAEDVARNVSPRLALEAMLLSVKEALTCQPSYR